MTIPLHPRAEAHGKVIVLGEHAVVYGYPAVAAGLPQGIVLDAAPRPDPSAPITLTIPAWDLDLELRADSEHPVARACLEVLAHCDGPVTGWAIRGSSALPPRAGLGSSAALTVALARLVYGPDAAIDDVVAASLAGERVFHGEPSGLDSRVAAQGGVLRYVRGESPREIRPGAPLPLVLVPSGIPRSTAEQVARCRQRLEQLPSVVRPVLIAIGQAVEAGVHAIEHGDLDTLGVLFDVAHGLLGALDVSSPALDRMAADARAAGARGAKLTGAGRGGCLLALAGDDPDRLAAAFPDHRPLFVEVAAS
jgi:mevalonate kinase